MKFFDYLESQGGFYYEVRANTLSYPLYFLNKPCAALG